MTKLRFLKGVELVAILEARGFEIEETSDNCYRFCLENAETSHRLTLPIYEYYVPVEVLETLVSQLSEFLSEDALSDFYHPPRNPFSFKENQDGLEHMRRRPGMYLHTQGSHGLHGLLDLALSSTINQALSDQCTAVKVTTLADEGFIIEDDGTALPRLLAANETIPDWLVGFVDHVMEKDSVTHMSGYDFQLLTAFSESSSICIRDSHQSWSQVYEAGIPTASTRHEINSANSYPGSRIEVHPDFSIIESGSHFNEVNLIGRLREIAAFAPGLAVTLVDERQISNTTTTFHYKDGMADLLRFINRDHQTLHEVVHARTTQTYKAHREATPYPISVDFAFQFVEDETEMVFSYANFEETLFDGIHVECLRSAVISSFINKADDLNLIDRSTCEIKSGDFFSGFTGLISVRTSQPRYCGQLRDRLVGDDIEQIAHSFIWETVNNFIDNNSDVLEVIIQRTLQRKFARDLRRYGERAEQLLTPIAKWR